MSNVYELPNNDDVYEQASQWIAKLDRALTAAEEQQLKQWLATPGHQEVLFEMARVWDSMDSLSRLSSLFPLPTRAPVAKPAKYAVAAAASVLVVLLSGLWGMMTFAPQAAPQWMMAWQTQHVDGVYETGIGEHSRVNLPDGSELVLNTNSRIQVKYTKEARLFFLERGEIHIQVAHDTSRPLSVIAGDKVVQAVGTAFNVQMYNDKEVELIVTDGKVRVAKRRQQETFKTMDPAPLPVSALAVSQGEKIVLGAKNQHVKKIEVADIEAKLSWRDGNLVFRGETLEEALAEISRYTDVNFNIEDDAIRSIRIAGLFKAGDITGLLSALKQNFRIDHRRIDDGSVSLRSI